MSHLTTKQKLTELALELIDVNGLSLPADAIMSYLERACIIGAVAGLEANVREPKSNGSQADLVGLGE